MRQDAQTDFAGLAVMRSRSQRRAEVTLEHAEYGFDLPTLAIGFLREAARQLLAVLAVDRGRLAVGATTATVGGRENASNAQLLTALAVERLALVAGVGQQRGEPLLDEAFEQGLFELHGVGLWAAVDDGCEN